MRLFCQTTAKCQASHRFRGRFFVNKTIRNGISVMAEMPFLVQFQWESHLYSTVDTVESYWKFAMDWPFFSQITDRVGLLVQFR